MMLRFNLEVKVKNNVQHSHMFFGNIYFSVYIINAKFEWKMMNCVKQIVNFDKQIENVDEQPSNTVTIVIII